MTENKDFWKERWQSHETPWDLKGPHSSLERLVETARASFDLSTGSRGFVPGCGRAHDAAKLAHLGFQVAASDFVPEAIEEAKVLYRNLPRLKLDVQDVFNVDANEFASFDFVFDRAMFCALDPSKRPRYLQSCSKRLKPGGLLLAILFFELEDMESEGPPFSVNPRDLPQLLSPEFELLSCTEIKGESQIEFIRSELLVVARKSAHTLPSS